MTQSGGARAILLSGRRSTEPRVRHASKLFVGLRLSVSTGVDDACRQLRSAFARGEDVGLVLAEYEALGAEPEAAVPRLLEADPEMVVLVLEAPRDPAVWQRLYDVGAAVVLVEGEVDDSQLPRAMATALHVHRLTLENRQAAAHLQDVEDRLTKFVRYAPAAVAMLDREMRYLVVSNRWLHDYRLEGRDLIGRSHYEIFPEVSDHWREIHRRCLEGASELCDEDPFPRADGTLDWVRWEIHPWHDGHGEIGGIMIFTEVITDRKRVEDAWRYLATHDHLTGLLNRRSLIDRLEKSMARAGHRSDYSFALLFLDLDEFKQVNDRHGHAAGDDLLKQLATRLADLLRPKDALARFAGDEFVALVEDVAAAEAEAIATRVVEQLGQPYDLGSRVVWVGASLGVAMAGAETSAQELLDRADAAMYEAKKAGGGAYYLAPARLTGLERTG